jgi:rubrerythrin
MTHLATAFEAGSFQKTLTREELARALRIAIADEYEAIQIYSQIAESADDPGIVAVVQEIIREEKKHAGQFWDLLTEIDPEESETFKEAREENRKIREKAKR